MYARLFWSLVIAIQCLSWTGGTAPALARGVAGQMGEAPGLGHAGVWGNSRLSYHGQSRYRLFYGQSRYRLYSGQWQHRGPGGVRPSWPYGAFVPAIQDQTPVSPEVIILTNAPRVGLPPPTSPAAMDFGYIPGCRAIPNGYHCDPARHEGQPN